MVNYRTTYNRFVTLAQKRLAKHQLDTSYKRHCFCRKHKLEVHHILPKNLGGNNDFNNLVLLSHEDHIYAHFLLNLALFQEGKQEDLTKLNYPEIPAKMLDMLNLRKNILRGLKVEVFLSGKNNPPTIMSIREITKILCVIRRWNFTNQLLFSSMIIKVIRAALFFRPIGGLKLRLNM
jgi:hypothetical protein